MLLKWLLYPCLQKNKQECLSLSSLGPRYIHFFSAQVFGAQTMLAAGVRFSKQLKWSTEPVAAGCQDIPGNLAVRQTARMSLKSRLCHRWLISAADFSFSAAWRCHHASSLFPLESEGVVLCCVCMCMFTCIWVVGEGEGGLRLGCAAGKSDDLYNVWATPAFGWALGMNVHVHMERILEMFRSSSLVCWNKMDAPT